MMKQKENVLSIKDREIFRYKKYNYSGQEYSYSYAHTWVYRKYGKASVCSNSDCKQISNCFQWSNISKDYKLDISDWQQLCRSCHAKYDVTDKTRELARKNRLGKQNTCTWKPIAKLQNGEIIEMFSCIYHAELITGVSTRAIANNKSGRSKHAGGFQWQV